MSCAREKRGIEVRKKENEKALASSLHITSSLAVRMSI